jgi:prophage regulatory protein
MKGALAKGTAGGGACIDEHYRPHGEKRGVPKRFWITDKRCAWNSEEIERWLDERQQNGTTEFAGKSLRLSSEYFARLVMRRDVAGEVLGKVVRMVSVPGRRIRLLFLLAVIFREGWIR